MKNVKLLLLLFSFLYATNGFSQNAVTYSPMTKTIDLNSGAEGTVDVLVDCTGSSSTPVFLNAELSCGDNSGILSTSYTNGSILTPGHNTIIRYKFKKTVTTDTQIVYKFSTNGSCTQNESDMIKITVNYKSGSTTPPTNPTDPNSNWNFIGFTYLPKEITILEGDSPPLIVGEDATYTLGKLYQTYTYSYQWSMRINDGAFVPIQGATSRHYLPGKVSAKTAFKRTVTYVHYGTTTTNDSNLITVNVIPPPLLQNNTIYFDGLSVLGTSPTGGLGNNSYQYLWYIIDEDGDNYQLPDTSPYLSITTPQFAGYLNSTRNFILKRVVASGNQILASNGITLPHVTPIQNNTISINGNTVTGSVPTGGLGEYKYSWAIYYTGDAIDFDETTKDLDLTSHLNQINTILQIDSAAKLVRIATSGVSSISNKLSLNTVAAKTSSNKENILISTAYPNPTTDSVNFTTASGTNQEIEIIIYSEGMENPQLVFKNTVAPNQVVKWDIPSYYPKGIYYYKIISANKEIKSGKIVYK